MLTPFIRRTGNRSKGLWHFLEEASHADIRLAELEYPSLNKMTTFCAGRTPIHVPPSSKAEVSLGCTELRQAIGILTPRISGP